MIPNFGNINFLVHVSKIILWIIFCQRFLRTFPSCLFRLGELHQEGCGVLRRDGLHQEETRKQVSLCEDHLGWTHREVHLDEPTRGQVDIAPSPGWGWWAEHDKAGRWSEFYPHLEAKGSPFGIQRRQHQYHSWSVEWALHQECKYVPIRDGSRSTLLISTASVWNSF